MAPLAYVIGSIVVVMMICLACHRLRRCARGMPIDELPQRVVDDRRHCYYHHDLLHHHQEHPRGFNQYQLEQPSPPSESDDEAEIEAEAEAEADQACDQDTSSPDCV